MALALKRYADGSYIPLLKPWVRRFSVDNSEVKTPVKEIKKKKPLPFSQWRQSDQMKSTLEKNNRAGRYSTGEGVGP
jgi:hypothetical protein